MVSISSSWEIGELVLNIKTKVSIITSVYLDLEGLKKTSASILCQSYSVEWIVVDSDSGSEIRKFLSNWKSPKHEISWISEKDRGLYDGMNKGFSMASGNIILFLNADDELANMHTIEEVVRSYEEDKWNWAVGLAVRVNKLGEPRMVWEYYKPSLGGLALGTRTFCHQATYYTRNLLEKIMPYTIDNLAADHHLNIKAFKISSPKMLTFVTCIFMDGGVSSNRPMRAAFKDLRRIRSQEGILLLNSIVLDVILSYFAIAFIKVGGFVWSLLRKLGNNIVGESYKPIYTEYQANTNMWTDADRRS